MLRIARVSVGVQPSSVIKADGRNPTCLAGEGTGGLHQLASPPDLPALAYYFLQETNVGTVTPIMINEGDMLWWQAEVEETLKRLQSQKGVQGIIVVNTEGIPIKSTMDNSTTTQYANLMHNFILKARSTVREIDPQNDLTFLRIRSKKNEIMVAPDKDYFLIVIQNPTE
ncbi:dynein light chain roadblock-type 1 [Rhynchocyon petersi]